MLKTLARAILSPTARVAFRPKVIGRRNVPRRGAVILASNHRSFIDSVVITLVAPRSVSFLAKSDYFTGRGLRGALNRWFFTGVGAVPVERGAGQAAQDALDAGLGILEAGDAFAIYPEGTRSLDGRLYKGRTGVAYLALTAGVPIVPVALTGTEQLQPVGSSRLHRAKVTVEFGEPIDASAFGEARSGRVRRELTDEVMRRIQAMSGQDMAPVYNEPPAQTIAERVKRVFWRERL
ncbi:lysophospholipid acyltransferase family protein [Homoserinibacter sp. YIM 151385]|uniref:lysophospholipid acyltransferase family protein n=1 Tax=Homoserinibacter sp. YIM 151385 TaxID=2985506 RepID=UPI0022EFE575|nr:lysophospholipid acyltransferase family protein [Homoserinibacter sp. YIM 151385]WBU37429.1 lysophospholipid acyltransferase family protein [Homoserinibacter sp. YIM 151385]